MTRLFTQRQVAKHLGISRNHVQTIERAALNKLRAVAGQPPVVPPKRIHYTGATYCTNCSEQGHNARSCPKPGCRLSQALVRRRQYLRTGK